jgi:hypothetical protein
MTCSDNGDFLKEKIRTPKLVAYVNANNMVYNDRIQPFVKFRDFHHELSFFAENYMIDGSLSEIIPHNIKIAEEGMKFNVSRIWKTFHNIFKEEENRFN